MKKRVALSTVLFALVTVLSVPKVAAQVWHDWDHHAGLEVRNNATASLPSGYTVRLVLNTADLISQGQMQDNCTDLRITYDNGVVESELDRLVEGCNTVSTTVLFQTQAEISLGGTDTAYQLYYGNPLAPAPPADPGNVYAFYDDFEDGDASEWSVKGTWSVVDDGGNHIYRYTGGGPSWAISYVDLAGVSDLEYVAKIRADGDTGDPGYTQWIGLAFRIQDQDNFLTFYQSRDTSEFKYARIVGDSHTIFQHPAFVMPADTWYWLRLQAIGNQVRARIWEDGSAEPTVWSIETTESNFQSETSIGATLYNHTTEADWDEFQVRRLVDVEPTVTLHWESALWWDNAWGYRVRLTVANNSSTDALPVGYSLPVTLDTSALIGAGQALNNCDDLRIVSFDGLSNTEIDRVVESCDSDQTSVWFSIQRAVGPSGEDDNYYLYYGNPAAGAPPSDAANVFLFYEDWEQGATHWTSAAGLDPADTGTMGTTEISSEESVSPSHSQKFPLKAAGGDAFSGYIPVAPSTGYAIGVWGKSATSAYAPVGIDPYDAGYTSGSETWLWTNEWTIGSMWSYRSARFTTAANTAYIKIKSEWWSDGPGTEPVYLDDLVLRYALTDEPTVTSGDEETILPVPEITDIADTGPVAVGTPVDVTAVVSSTEGTIDTVTLQLQSPETADVSMSLIFGDVSNGTWQGSFTPSEGGAYTYRVLATSSAGRSKLSEAHVFTSTDTEPPEITLVSVLDPIQVRDTQTLTVSVTDNGRVDQVTVEVGGDAHPMVQDGDQYDYSWRVMMVGTLAYTVTATDTVGNSAELVGSFESLAREVDVCIWKECQSGAASFSVDDGNSSCRTEMEDAGFRGTYYYNGSSTPSWLGDYSGTGHEIGSHTVGHPCDSPCCFPTCTPEAIWECPYTEAEVIAYRESQLEPNIAAIEAGTGVPVVSMAWPCGCADARRMTAASYYYLGARGYHDHIAELYWVQDVNEPTPTEFMNLNSARSYDQTFIDRAIDEGKWAIITSHGSCAGIDYIGSQSDVLWAAPVGEVLKYILVRDAAQFTNYDRFGQTISFDATHDLGTFERQQVDGTPMSTIVFDNPVTLKAHVLDTDDVLSVEVDGVPVSFVVRTLEGARYVLFDASLEVARHVVVTLAQPAPTIEDIVDNSPVELGDSAHVNATVTIVEGTVQAVTLQVLSPEAAEYPMTLVGGSTDTYAASFVPGQLGEYSYQVLASNDEGNTAQSLPQTLLVQDTTPPSWRAQSQAHDAILVGELNTLTAEGLDLGGLEWAILATDESGTWQEFTWPVTDWWDHDWLYRRAINVTEAAGLARTAETVDLYVSEAEFPGLTNCAAELRVTDDSGSELPVQVYDERMDGGTLTCQLLFQADVGANASRTCYVYYGNSSATPPTYATDLTSSIAGDLLTVGNSFFDLDLDTDAGVVSRVRLPAGSNTNLPLSPETDSYWGWHQVCSSDDGNITGKDQLCTGGSAPATGLALATTLDGPLAKEFNFTSIKGAATYSMTFRFYANAPYYEYSLNRTGTSASVMNNFWYANGNFGRLGVGSGGLPATFHNTYGDGADQARIASFASVDYGSIDGLDNDGTDLGGTDYRYPSASGLELYVTSGATQEATQEVLGRLAAPVTAGFGAVEEAPEGQYGSPMDLGGATDWTPSAFAWQNPAISAGTTVQWRIKYCDLSDNCGTTDAMSFIVGGWYDAAWPYRRPIDVSNPCGEATTDYQVQVTLDSGTIPPGDGSDVRIAADDGVTPIPFWIEEWENDLHASIWIKVSSIPLEGTSVYMYYGNASATSAASGDDTFEFFDDFDSSSAAEGYYPLGAAQTVLVQDQGWEGSAPHTLSVVEFDSGGYQYWGYYGLVSGDGGVGLARSNDLVNWDKYESNPVSLNGRFPSVIKVGGTFYMAVTKDYGSTSQVVLRTSTDGISFTEVETMVPPVAEKRNQNPNLFLNPNDGLYYLYWYSNNSGQYDIMAKSAADPYDLDIAPQVTVVSSPSVLAAPNMMYYDSTYFLSTEINPGEWQVRIYASDTSAVSGFVALPDNPILEDGSACFFQHVFGDELHAYYCKLTGSTWTVDHRMADLSAGRSVVQSLDPSKWTASGGSWTLETTTEQDGSTGLVANGTTSARQVLLSSFAGDDYVLQAHGKQVSGRVWGLGARVTDADNLYSINLYEDLDHTDNLYNYRWASGGADIVAQTALGTIEPDTWYKMTVKVHGSSIQAYIDDVLDLDGTDALYASGHVALYGEASQIAQFNDVFVRRYCGAEPAVVVGAEEEQVPTAVDLVAFNVTAEAGEILLTWETANEIDVLGFNLYRAEEIHSPRIRLNDRLISGQAPGSPMGAVYQSVDATAEAGVAYYYWLESRDIDGSSTTHGPLKARVDPLRRLLPVRPRPVPQAPGLDAE